MNRQSKPRLLRIAVFAFSLAAVPAHSANELERDGAETVDWADLIQGAVVEQQDRSFRDRPENDAWGILGMDGGRRLVAPYPYEFTIDLGQVREVRSLRMTGPAWTEWAPDIFTIWYEDSEGNWQTLLEESNWAGMGQVYFRVLDAAIQTRRVRLQFKQGGWGDVSPRRKRAIEDGYGNNLLMSEFNLYPTGELPGIAERFVQYLYYASEKVRFLNDEMLRETHVPADYDKLLDDYQQLTDLAIPGKVILDSDVVLAQEVNDRLREIASVVASKRNEEMAGDTGYVIGLLNSLERTQKDSYTGPVNNSLTLEAARAEFEDFQIAVAAVSTGLENLRVEVTPPVAVNNEKSIPAEGIHLYRVGYLETQSTGYPVDYVGFWPDILFPASEEVVHVKKGTVQPFWVTVYVPRDQAPGEYVGTIRVISSNAPAMELTYRVYVWDFALPEEIALQNVFSLSKSYYQAYFGKEMSPDVFRQYSEFMLQRRLNPTTLYLQHDPQPSYELMDFCIERGMNIFNVGYAYGGAQRATKEYFQTFLHKMQEHEEKLRHQGTLDRAFIYLADEPSTRDHDEIIRRGHELNKVTSIPKALALHFPLSSYPEDYQKVTDIWMPTVDVYDRKWAEERRTEGAQVWWYIVGWGFNMDQPALRTRIFPWLSWKEGVDGIMQWIVMDWWKRAGQTVDNWSGRSFATNNGVGNYIYPGPDGEPIPSMRLENLRDGMEDYEYFSLLKQILEIEQNRQKPDQEFLEEAEDALSFEGLVGEKDQFSNRPDLLWEKRSRIGRLIERKAYLLAQ